MMVPDQKKKMNHDGLTLILNDYELWWSR